MRLKLWEPSWGSWTAALAVVAVVAISTWSFFGRNRTVAGGAPTDSAERSGSSLSVEVISPRAGGMDRKCVQPGTVEPFESADLYAKISGFLVEQNVDIGYPVKAGDILARIAVPEYEKQVKQDTADVVRSEARVEQMTAAIVTAEADLGAATAAIAFAQAEKKSKASFRKYREQERDRILELVAGKSLERRLGEEQENHYQSAVAAESASIEAIVVAQQKERAARARVKQAEADLKYVQAEVESAKAKLEKSQAILDFAVIRSPYTGVVTKRNFHPGDFIRSADSGGDRTPVLSVERTDVMRVVVQVPERDVPFVDRGDPAVVEVDALPGVVYKSRGDDKVEISRLAASEDPHTRMMRTEVHVANTDGKLRRGMFGRVLLTLQIAAANAVRIPSASLTGKADAGKGTVRVVRDGKVAFVTVVYGSDNGSDAEVLSGLTTSDQVIVRASGPLTESTPVTVIDSKR